MGKVNSRAKGASAERKVCEVLGEWSGLQFKRSPASGGLRGHIQEFTIGDIICTTKGYWESFPYCVEVKNYKEIDFSSLINRINPRSKNGDYVNCVIDDFWEQCIGDAKRGEKLPLLMMRYSSLPKDFYFVVMDRKIMNSIPGVHRVITRNRIVTEKYIIMGSHDLVKKSWKKFLKQSMAIWKNLYG